VTGHFGMLYLGRDGDRVRDYVRGMGMTRWRNDLDNPELVAGQEALGRGE
jgi:hypothetical protein